MGADYFSPDGGGSGESKHKECPVCDGIGRNFQNGEPDEQDPDGVDCMQCGGTGWLEVSQDELEEYHKACLDNEADLKHHDI